MPGRKYPATGGLYRYGFNGKEKENEVVQYDYGFRIYDARLVRFKSVDPLQKQFPELTPYQFSSNSPIDGVDLDGRERMDYRLINNRDGANHLQFISSGPTKATVGTWPFDRTINVPVHVRIEYKGEHYLFAWGPSRSADLSSYLEKVSFPAPITYNSSDFHNFLKNPNAAYQSEEDASSAFMHELIVRTAIGLAEESSNSIIASKISNRIGSLRKSTTDAPNDQAISVNGGITETAKSNTANNSKPSTLRPGPYAKESIPAKNTAQTFTPQERAAINKLGSENGCHTCGAKSPGTKTGNWVPDHQPASAIIPAGTAQVLLPHCIGCSRKQGGDVTAEKRKTVTKSN